MTRRAYRARVLAALPATQTEIHAATGLGKVTIWRWIKDLHAAGECHIGGWRRGDGGTPFQARYVAGEGEDVPCRLKPLTGIEIGRRYRERLRKSGSWAEKLARQRAVHWADRAKIKGDPLVAAFFGRSA